MDIVAVVNNDANTLALFDVTDPTAIIAKGTIATGSLPRCCFVVGNYVYVTCFGANRLDIFDITDPDSIVAKDTITTGAGSGPLGLYVAGNYAYVCQETNDTLSIFDISDPDNIVAKDTIVTNLDGPANVVVVGNYAYVTSRINGKFCIYDISDPTNIVAKDTHTFSPTYTNPVGLAVNEAGTRAYVACQGSVSTLATANAVVSLDVSDPDNISVLDTLTVEIPPLANQAYLSGDYLYITGQSTGDSSCMLVIDVTNPASMAAVGADSTGLSTSRGVYVFGDYAFVCSGANDTLIAYDITTKRGIIQKDLDATNLSGPTDVFIDATYAYVTSSSNDRICVYDISDIDAIVAKDYNQGTVFDIAEACWAIFPYIYTVNRSTTYRRLQIVDATDPTNLVNKGSITTNFNAPSDVQVDGNYAYVLQTGTNTLAIYDISNPLSPVAKDTDNTGLSLTSTVSGLFKLGNYVYVCSTGNNTLAIFDVSDPTAIVPKDTITTNLAAPHSVVVSGNYAYVSNSGSPYGIAIFDISDPTNIVAKGYTSARATGVSRDIAKKGNYIFLADNDTINVYDVSDVENPTFKTSLGSTLDNVLGLYINGDVMAALSTNDNALCLFDVSDVNGIMIADEITTNLNNPYWVHGDISLPPPAPSFLPQAIYV